MDSFRKTSYKVDGFARFTDNEGNVINRGALKINNKIINGGINNSYDFEYRDTEYNEGKNLYGKKIQIEIQGNKGIESVKTNIETPQELFPPTVNNLPSSVIDRNSNYPLYWNPDPSNEFHKVQIQLTYYKGLSQHNISSMPNAIESAIYTVNDNGFFLIPKNDLQRFPEGAYIVLSIGRASTSNTGNIEYLVIALAKTIPLLVVQDAPLNADFSLITNTTNPCSFTATSIVNGGKPPYYYIWSTFTGNDPTMTIIGYQNTVSGTGTCSANYSSKVNRVPEDIFTYLHLKVTDANYNTVSISKQLKFSSTQVKNQKSKKYSKSGD